MQIHADLRRKQTEITEEPCLVADIIELPESDYASLYQNLLKERGYFLDKADMEAFIDGQRCCLLVLGEGQEDGILVDTQGSPYAYLSSFVPNARTLVNNHIRQLADYVVSEGTEHTEDGRWANTYDELYHHFGANITDKNGNGKLLREELQQREEINELIMTEDCIEISYHLEYCQNCGEGGIEGTMDLLSLMGCNLYDVHFDHEADGFEIPTVSELNKDTLTEEGKKEWSDVLGAAVESLRYGNGCLICKLTDCDPFRLQTFAEMLNGQCEAENYDAWVTRKGVAYASTTERNRPDFERRYSADLVATYEDLMEYPSELRITAYYGDLSLHHFKYGVTENEIRSAYDKALDAMEMTEEEFNAQSDRFRYRGEIIGRMRDCLLADELRTGEEVLFVAPEPYAGADDFDLRGGIVMAVDKEQKTCTMRGEFFTMENVPLHYVLGRHDMHAEGKHYGFENVQPLYGENPVLAQHYLKEVQEVHNARMNPEQARGDSSAPVLSM